MDLVKVVTMLIFVDFVITIENSLLFLSFYFLINKILKYRKIHERCKGWLTGVIIL